jgi:hypothetical protein
MNYRAGDLSLRTHDIVYENTAMWDEIPLNVICKPEVQEHETQAFTEEEREDARKFFESALH